MKKNKLKIDIILLFFVCVLYVVNTFLIDTTNIFMNGYFNDLIAPIGVLSFLNIVISLFNVRFEKIIECMMFIFLCGLFWEFSPIKEDAVRDICDIVCYEGGTIIYLIIHKIYFVKRHQE